MRMAEIDVHDGVGRRTAQPAAGCLEDELSSYTLFFHPLIARLILRGV